MATDEEIEAEKARTAAFKEQEERDNAALPDHFKAAGVTVAMIRRGLPSSPGFMDRSALAMCLDIHAHLVRDAQPVVKVGFASKMLVPWILNVEVSALRDRGFTVAVKHEDGAVNVSISRALEV